MARKIIQIAASYEGRDHHAGLIPGDRLFALCDDGTVWLHRWQIKDTHTSPYGDAPERWERLVKIPQEKSRFDNE